MTETSLPVLPAARVQILTYCGPNYLEVITRTNLLLNKIHHLLLPWQIYLYNEKKNFFFLVNAFYVTETWKNGKDNSGVLLMG